MQKEMEDRDYFKCHICLSAFIMEEIMLQHIDEGNFYSCPINFPGIFCEEKPYAEELWGEEGAGNEDERDIMKNWTVGKTL